MQIYRPQFVFYVVIILLWLIGTPLHAALNIEILEAVQRKFLLPLPHFLLKKNLNKV